MPRLWLLFILLLVGGIYGISISAYSNPPQAGRVNVALASEGATVTASSIYNASYPASSIINGDRKGLNWGNNGGWADGTIGEFPDWVRVNFSGTKTIDEIDVFTIQDNYSNPTEPTETMTFTEFGITDFNVQYWDGANWVAVPNGNVTGNNKVWRKFTFSSITTDKIRVYITNALANNSRLAEVEAYSVADSSATGIVSGKVTRLDGTTAIAAASIKLYLGTAAVRTATANSTGDYSITGVSTGTYTVEASAAGYETKSQTGVTVTNGATTTVNLSLAVPINYVYDELGRLAIVIDKDGNAATYTYDSVGNLLSISRQNSTQASIIRFSPSSGPVGTSVTIYGTGFSATASQNTVTINGVSATVTASSPTQIVTSVPSGATTGPIVVTSPTGSATSSTSFTVSASTGAPTITGFTPTIGTIGSAVTIHGTNFETIAGNNRVKFNITHTPASSATSTSITTTVPQTGSGRITVATPSGNAVSSTDFFIPPWPYTASDVEFTGRMAIGESRVLSVNTATKTAIMLFDGTVGKRLSISISNNTLALGSVIVYDPYGTVLYSSSSFHSSTFIDTMNLTGTGTYTIFVDPESTVTGSMTLTLYDVAPDINGTISIGGPSVGMTITTPGQNGRLTFSGTAGQKVGLSTSNWTIATCTTSIKKPDGTTLASTFGSFIDSQTLPVTGTYTVFVDPTNASTGGVTLTLNNTNDVTGTVTVGGPSVTVTISTPGQNGQLTFSGTSGQQVTVRVTNNSMSPVTVDLLKPDGSTLTSTTSYDGSFNLTTQTLPTTGTYTIRIDPSGAITGSLSVSVTSP